MAGQTLQVLDRQIFDFSYLAGNTSETRVLVGKIPTSQWTEASLLVRAHTVDIAAGGAGQPGYINVEIIADASTNEDPANAFLGSTVITGGDVTIAVSTLAGAFAVTPITGDIGSMVAIRVVAMQNTAASGANLVAGISADLILRAG